MDKTLSSGTFKVLPVLVCGRGEIWERTFGKIVEGLKKNLSSDIQVLKGVIINEEKEVLTLKESIIEADLVLLYKPHLGLGNCVLKMAEFGLPIILFNEENQVWTPLDALEYIYPRENLWVAINYEDINSRLNILSAKKKIEKTRILILNADYTHWEKFLCRVSGGLEAIREKFGIEVSYVKSDEVVKRWESIDEKNAKIIAEEWMKGAKKIVEPEEDDFIAVARLYLVMKDILKEEDAQAITMAYGDDHLPVPCFAYTNLRDEGIPAACEADIISLLSMIILHWLTYKPSFMGNTFIDPDDNAIIITHCVCPRKMAGYNISPVRYTLRNYHNQKFTGSLTAFVKMGINQEVTVCRLSGDLRDMLVTRGVVVDCKNSDDCEDISGYCRMVVKIKIDAPKKFIHKTSGNHQVMVYGDYREELRELNKLLGITTVEV